MTFRACVFIGFLRPKQWSKNLLLFAGLIFSLNLFQASLFLKTFTAFVAFCLFSSCAYIINDITDIEEDRQHPRKKSRPLAAGEVTLRQAAALFIVLLSFSLWLAWSVNFAVFVLGSAYFCLCLTYSLWFKHIVIIDVFTIAVGFLLRAVAGGAAIKVHISPWLLICTLLLALFLAFTKRRQEVVNLGNKGTRHRRVLEHYPLTYLDQLISIVTAATILAYSLYTFTASHTSLFMLTIPFVIYGIFRYLYLVHKKNMGESPEEILFHDLPMLINICLWVLVSIFILYPA